MKQVKKSKWSLSNLMTAVHILLNSHINLYDFLNLPVFQRKLIAEAYLDRIVHKAMKFCLLGESLRKKY